MTITSRLFITALAIVAASRQVLAAKNQVCSLDACIKGSSSSHVLVTDPETHTSYIPGSYSSTSSTSQTTFITPLNQSSTHPTDASDAESSLVISHPTSPYAFSKPSYKGDIRPLDAASFLPGAGDARRTSPAEGWKSLYLPASWYAVPADRAGQVLWGVLVDEKELPKDLKRGIVRISSTLCSTPCSSHGVCVPSLSNGTNAPGAVCQCQQGWAGTQCERCAEGFYGSECKSCQGDCTACDDGLSGTGVCIGTKKDASECGCSHGSCGPDESCTCSAGYTTDTNVSSQKCDTCIEGFYRTADGDCTACPWGCSSCTLRDGSSTEAVCTACVGSLQLSSAEVARCQSPAQCGSASFWSNSTGTCERCSPACASCHGPSANQCLTCSAPRMNMNGQCVGVDGKGVCDTTLANVQGVFVGNNDKGRCDACPVGCSECSIPSFTTITPFASLRCSACTDGYLLQDGKCVKTCEAGWFLPTGSADKSGTCQRCSSGCAECIGSADSCTKCASPFFASGGKCITSCPSGTLSMNGTCATCHPDCATCSSPSATSCSSCPSSRPILSNGQCIEYCPKSSYYTGSTDSSSGRQCAACDWTCASCSGAGGKSCTSCADGYTLRGGACVAAFDTCGPAGFAHGYGLCVNALLDRPDKRYLGFLVIPVLGLIGAGAWWYVRRERRKTREASERFRDGMDEVDVQKRVGKYRLERLLGMERARLTGDAEALAEDGAKQKERKKLRELLLPSKHRVGGSAKEQEAGLELSAAAHSRGSLWNTPPPPYAPSSPSVEGERDAKHPLPSARTVSSGHFSPSYAPSDSFSEAQYASKQQRAGIEATNERIHLASESRPYTTEAGPSRTVTDVRDSGNFKLGGLLPPPRPAASSSSGIGGKARLDEQKERKTLRFADGENRRERNWMDEVDELGTELDVDMGIHHETAASLRHASTGQQAQASVMRLSELWPDMKGRKAEGWV